MPCLHCSLRWHLSVPMPLVRYTVQDERGEPIAPLVSVRSEWRVGDRLVLRGTLYRVVAIVRFDAPDGSGAVGALTVAHTI